MQRERERDKNGEFFCAKYMSFVEWREYPSHFRCSDPIFQSQGLKKGAFCAEVYALANFYKSSGLLEGFRYNSKRSLFDFHLTL